MDSHGRTSNALIDAFDPAGEESICVPTHDRKRGHPVLWSQRHFAEMKRLGGDKGARDLLEKYAGAVKLVPVDDAAVHLDVDTDRDARAAPAATHSFNAVNFGPICRRIALLRRSAYRRYSGFLSLSERRGCPWP